MSQPDSNYHRALTANRKLLEQIAALQAENERLKKIGFKMREMIGDHHWTLAWDRECKYSPNAAKGGQS